MRAVAATAAKQDQIGGVVGALIADNDGVTSTFFMDTIPLAQQLALTPATSSSSMFDICLELVGFYFSLDKF